MGEQVMETGAVVTMAGVLDLTAAAADLDAVVAVEVLPEAVTEPLAYVTHATAA